LRLIVLESVLRALLGELLTGSGFPLAQQVGYELLSSLAGLFPHLANHRFATLGAALNTRAQE